MSFDEQPDGDIHGECAAEIRRLEQALRDKTEELSCCESDLLRWRTSYEHSCTQNVHLCAKIDDCRPFLKDGESPAEGLARFREKITEIFGRWTLFMDAQKEALTEGGKMIPDDRYKQIMAGLGMPNSRSLLCALQQVANEVGRKYSADAIELEDIADKASARASISDLNWQRVSHDKEALQSQLDACRPYLKEGETVADALARLSASDKWQPIATAPAPGVRVLATWDNTWSKGGEHIEVCEAGERGEWFYSFDCDAPATEPTHWMPLPSAPTTKETT